MLEHLLAFAHIFDSLIALVGDRAKMRIPLRTLEDLGITFFLACRDQKDCSNGNGRKYQFFHYKAPSWDSLARLYYTIKFLLIEVRDDRCRNIILTFCP